MCLFGGTVQNGDNLVQIKNYDVRVAFHKRAVPHPDDKIEARFIHQSVNMISIITANGSLILQV